MPIYTHRFVSLPTPSPFPACCSHDKSFRSPRERNTAHCASFWCAAWKPSDGNRPTAQNHSPLLRIALSYSALRAPSPRRCEGEERTSIMSLVLTEKERTSSSTLRLGSRLKISCIRYVIS